MIPDYFFILLGLAALSFTVRTLTDTYFMIRDYQDAKK
jgi:hypothetical protein